MFSRRFGVGWLAPAPPVRVPHDATSRQQRRGDPAAAALAAAPQTVRQGAPLHEFITGDYGGNSSRLAECIALSRLDLKGNGIGDEGVSAC